MAKLTALDLVLAIVPRIPAVVEKLRLVDRQLADQLRRAVTSIALNLAEADGNRDGNRRVRLETAHGSANEARIALQLAAAWGHVEPCEVEDLIVMLDRAGAMTWSRMQSI